MTSYSGSYRGSLQTVEVGHYTEEEAGPCTGHSVIAVLNLHSVKYARIS